MNRILIFVIATLIPFAALADHHLTAETEIRDAVSAFNAAYAENRVDDYFGHYADDATVYFSGARQDMKAYYREWVEMIDAGGSVEKNEMSDLRIQVMPSGDVGIATYFVDYRSRAPVFSFVLANIAFASASDDFGNVALRSFDATERPAISVTSHPPLPA